MYKDTARQAISCIDLTNLDDSCDTKDIDALCARAQTPHGDVAAVCVRPEFVPQAASVLSSSPIRVATVINFPNGTDDVETVRRAARQAILDGADEIDLVIPYRLFLTGEIQKAAAATREMVRAVSEEGPNCLKAILETGELVDPGLIAVAALASLRGGATFLKTSTGRTETGADPVAAEVLLDIATSRTGEAPVGFKPSGGIRSLDDAIPYLGLTQSAFGKTPEPSFFRIGASGLLDALCDHIEGNETTSCGPRKEY